MKLRDYQLDGVQKLRKLYQSGVKRALFVLPTGGGKTAVFSFIAQAAELRKKSAIILVHRQELLSQASNSLHKLGVTHGLISPRYSQSKDLIQIATVQSLVKRLDKVSCPDLIIIDECHHAVSQTYRNILAYYPSAHVLGVTASPIRGDGQGLGVKSGGIFESMIQGPAVSWLMSQGFLARARVFAPPIGIDLAGVPKRMGDYDKTELANRIDKPTITGSAVEHYLRLCKGQPAIAFCVSVKHAEHVANEFRNAGIRAVRVDGKMDDHSRKQAIEGLGNGSVDLLTSADLINEGLDVPACSVAILLRPTFSKSLHLQQIGRALRVAPNKTHATILDHVGNIMRHGFPDDEQNWELDPERDEKRKQKRDLDLTVRIEQCPECFFVYELGPTFCPSCGSEKASKERKIRVAEGQLEELKKEEMERAKIATRREQGEAQTVEELTELGKKRGYANPRFWAERILNGRKRK